MANKLSPAAPAQHDAGTAAIAAELGTHTAHLETLVKQGHRERALEDAQTFAFPSGAAAAFTFTPAVPQTAAVEIETWQSGNPGVPFVLLDGEFTAAQVANLIPATASGYVPVLMTVPTGRAKVHRRSFSGSVTIASIGSPTAAVFVTVRVRADEYELKEAHWHHTHPVAADVTAYINEAH